MANADIDSSDYTAALGTAYDQTAAYGDTTIFPNKWEILTLNTDGATGEGETTYQCDWTKWHGYYRRIPELAAVIDKKAIWTVGKGFKLTGSKETQSRIKRIKGCGKDSFNSIMHNAIRTYTICGDFFAEIIRDKKGRLINLKPINPGSMKIVVNAYGMIIRYEQIAQIGTKKIFMKFKPEDILHFAWNRIADEIHGIPTIQKLEDMISSLKEAKQDMRVVFHRYVKPLLITEVDTDDPTEIAAFKAKLDASVSRGENLIIPKDTANVERVSIPQYSTLDPLPWMRMLQKRFIEAEGIPNIILGTAADEDTEASAKILYLAFQQMIEFNQLFLEEQLKLQLGLDIDFEFPASIEPEMQEDEKKDGKENKKPNVDPSKHE